MGHSIYLPSSEDTFLNINIPEHKKPVRADAFDLEEMFVDAQRKSDEMGTRWNDEFPSFFKSKYGVAITPAQAILLWSAQTQLMGKLKKSLSGESVDSEKSVTPSKQKQRRKKK